MLGLKLRKEFEGRRMQGTVVDLQRSTAQAAQDFLEITFPSSDVLRALRALHPDEGRAVVLFGSKGRGKSHLMATLHHALSDGDATRAWLQRWADRLGRPEVAEIPMRSGVTVVSQSLHEQKHDFLWEPVFQAHRDGARFQGRWEERRTRKGPPPKDLLEEMFSTQPMALLFDEFQTWFDGLEQSDRKPHRVWAFNFVQLLSEIASEHPEWLLLVVSVRDGETDAYQQIHRLNPLNVDFKGPDARRDRQSLLLHRLFENRQNVNEQDIEAVLEPQIRAHAELFAIPSAEQATIRKLFIEGWPYAPTLLELLEDQILVATAAQETRDLIKILAGLYKRHGEQVPLLTAADFDLEQDSFEVGALLDSVSGSLYRNLKDRALRNMHAVQQAVPQWRDELPQLPEILAALWIRSLAPGNVAGAEARDLQLDVTRGRALDPNRFAVQLDRIEENSFNLHRSGPRLVFREQENPQARLLAEARNDRLFADGADERELIANVRWVLGAESGPRSTIVVVLGKGWHRDPWSAVSSACKPEQWGDQIPLVVLPQAPREVGVELGRWLKDHVPGNRNTVRFLYSQSQPASIFFPEEGLLHRARLCLKAEEYKFADLLKSHRAELRGLIKQRYDRAAILESFDFGRPEASRFRSLAIKEQGAEIPAAVDRSVQEDLFEYELFDELALAAAQEQRSLADFLTDLRNPRPGGQQCVPWVGEALVKEKLLSLCASGRLRLNLRGNETLQSQPGELKADAEKRLRGRLGSGRELEKTLLLPPAAQGASQLVSTGPAFQDPSPHHGSSVAAQPTATTPSLFDRAPSASTENLQAPATSSVSLLGQLERWNIGPGHQVSNVALKLPAQMTGAQLQRLLRNLPDGFRYELELQVERAH